MKRFAVYTIVAAFCLTGCANSPGGLNVNTLTAAANVAVVNSIATNLNANVANVNDSVDAVPTNVAVTAINTDAAAVNEIVNEVANENSAPAVVVETKTEATVPQTATVALQVSTPSSVTKYSVEIAAGSTLEQVMQSAKSQGLTYSTKGYGDIGTYVKSINGLDEDRHARFYWIIYVNGSRATAGMSTLRIHNGDTYKWNYEKEL